MKNEKIMKICRVCGLIWICSFPAAFGALVLTKGDFTQLGVVLEHPNLVEHYTLIKFIFNIGLNLHISTAMPAALALIGGNKKSDSKGA